MILLSIPIFRKCLGVISDLFFVEPDLHPCYFLRIFLMLVRSSGFNCNQQDGVVI